jgi:uncharacterized membrane protein YheB (UPF0754 family)
MTAESNFEVFTNSSIHDTPATTLKFGKVPLNMNEFISTPYPWLGYLVVPLVGGFIGYLTNRIAIRMLFRPLKKWRIGPIPVPLTPGVIPSKRYELAENIGEMVGEHLITADQVNIAVQQPQFQAHLFVMISSRVEAYLSSTEAGTASLIPAPYERAVELFIRVVSRQTAAGIQNLLHTTQIEQLIEHNTQQFLASVAETPIDALVDERTRTLSWQTFETFVHRLCASPATTTALHAYLTGTIRDLFESELTVTDLIGKEGARMIAEAVGDQAEPLVKSGVLSLRTDSMRTQAVDTICAAIDKFIESLGPRGAMLKGFINVDTLREHIAGFLNEREDQVADFLAGDTIVTKVRTLLLERARAMLATPLAKLCGGLTETGKGTLAHTLADSITKVVHTEQTAALITQTIRTHLTELYTPETTSIGGLQKSLGNPDLLHHLGQSISASLLCYLRTDKARNGIEKLLYSYINSLRSAPAGKLGALVPRRLRNGLYRFLQEQTTTLLVAELPGVLATINIAKIATDRINTFDLLRIERLLLLIMQEQFKYINLFGAILGFTIGCVNVLVLILLQ